MANLRCNICKKSFRGPQGLASHIRWHENQENPQVSNSRSGRGFGPFQERLINVLENHPNGISCADAAVEIQKAGWKKGAKTSEIAQRVSSTASAPGLKSLIKRTGRGIYQLRAGKKTARATLPVSEIETGHELTAPKIPVEALHIQIEHLQNENRRLHMACKALMPAME